MKIAARCPSCGGAFALVRRRKAERGHVYTMRRHTRLVKLISTPFAKMKVKYERCTGTVVVYVEAE